MRAPSIVPQGGERDIYKVEDDLGELGRIWPEADSEVTDFETVVTDLLTGQYRSPVRVIAFNVAEGWSRDVSTEIAHELRHRAICSSATFRSSCRISATATKAAITTSSFRCRSGSSEPCRSGEKSPRRLVSKRLSRASLSRH
jgi:hypothetical protein